MPTANASSRLRTRHDPAALSNSERLWTFCCYTLLVGAEYWIEAGLLFFLIDIAGGIGVSIDEASWIFTAHAMAYAAGMCLSHRMSHFLGNRRYLVLMASVAACCSLLTAASSTLPWIMGFRILGAFAGGTFLPRALVFITHRYVGKERGTANIVFSVAFIIIGRIAGPMLMGLAVDHLNWRFIFLGAVPFQLAGAALLYMHAVEYWDEHVEEHRPDLIGIGLLFVAIALLQITFDRGEIEGWFDSPAVCWLAAITLVANLGFVFWQLWPGNRQPLIDLRHLGRRRGMLANAVLAVFFGAFLSASLFLLPQYLRETESETHSAAQTGVLMGFSGTFIMLGLLLTNYIGQYIARFGARTVLFGFSLLQLTSMGLFVEVLTSNTPDVYLLLPIALTSLYAGFMTPGITIAGFFGMDLAEISNARTLYYASRALGSSLGVTLVNVLLDRRLTLHSQRLLENVFSAANTSVLRRHTNLRLHDALNLSAGIAQQATIMSMVDICMVLALLTVLSWAAILIFPPKPKAVH